jgi:allantoinase
VRFPRIRDGELLEAFGLIRETGLTAGVHAENDEIIRHLIGTGRAAGRTGLAAHLETRPPVSETESVLKGLELARAAGVRFHLYHASCRRSIDLARWYRDEGLSVTVETCPHYLVLDEARLEELDSLARINPPVRGRKEADALWEAVAQGGIHCLSSDHVAWPLARKHGSSIFDAACGAPGVETLLPLTYDRGVGTGRIGINDLIRVLCENPARIFGLYPRKGTLAPGSDADLVVLDPTANRTLRTRDMHSTADWSLYEGMQVRGVIRATVVRGMVVARDGRAVGPKGHGTFIRGGAGALPGE